MRVTLSCGRSCSVRICRVFLTSGSFAAHAAGDVNQENEVGGRQGFDGGVFGFDADADELGLGLPRGIGGFYVHGEGFAVLGLGIGVVKIIDDFFGADGGGGGQVAVVEQAAGVGIAACVYVYAERGDGLLGNGADGVGVLGGIAFGVSGQNGGGRRANHEGAFAGNGVFG